MEITKTTTHNVVFSVEYFENSEGGMDWDDFGSDVETLEEAIHLLDLAKSTNREEDWVIVCRVETTNKKENR